ncbi:DUF397 domain-containing protein [Kitasatospora sp. NPDC093550]|uniref:DUF397 domain-containing protein n=1 Tax=Kitasatospora sp. NPDC093550 TaxID=3364089 RepID=UPI0037FD5C48
MTGPCSPTGDIRTSPARAQEVGPADFLSTRSISRDNSPTTWRKSTHSTDGGQCVEVADGIPDLVPVRDSTDPSGPALHFPSPAGKSFITALSTGEFDAC